jgi:hypothetical protein
MFSELFVEESNKCREPAPHQIFLLIRNNRDDFHLVVVVQLSCRFQRRDAFNECFSGVRTALLFDLGIFDRGTGR